LNPTSSDTHLLEILKKLLKKKNDKKTNKDLAAKFTSLHNSDDFKQQLKILTNFLKLNKRKTSQAFARAFWDKGCIAAILCFKTKVENLT
jgi:hypothetical protein